MIDIAPAELPPRLFATDQDVRRLTAGLLAHCLPRPQWTHEAHLAAVCVLILEYPELHLDSALPDIIRSYNSSVGGVNSDREGYHETLTQFWLRMARCFLTTHPGGTLIARINRFILSEQGRRDAPLRYYSRERLFSVEARRTFLTPDLA